MYEKRIVLFLDMMGFKEKLSDPKELVRAIVELKSILRPADHETKYTQIDFIHFSDSIVIAAKTEYLANAMTFLLRLVDKVNTLVCKHEIPVRGAIVSGDYFYQNEILLSPAMAEAYSLESRFARYPRIIVSKSFTDHMSVLYEKTNKFSHYLSDYEFITMIDNDGFRFLNYLSASGATDPAIEQKTETDITKKIKLLKNHHNFIVKNISNAKDESVREKYIWAGNYHNRFLREEKELDFQVKADLFVNVNLLRLNH